MASSPDEISALLGQIETGDAQAASRLLPIVYAELRRLAARYMRGERPGQTIQPTELVHEAYLRLVGGQPVEWQSRSHFLALAATSMRRILVERARAKNAEKRGGGGEKLELDERLAFSPEKPNEVLALDEALHQLAQHAPRQSRIVELRFFGGLSIEEIAAVEGIGARTVKRDWVLARAWLHREIARGN